MLSSEEVHYFLKLNKVLEDPNILVDLSQKRNRLELISIQDRDHKFRMDITTNPKIVLKATIHHFETNSYLGLMRIDFRGRHKNPEEVLDTLPEKLKRFRGKWFDIDEPHMHVFVEDYSDLAWAVPLSETNFGIQEIKEMSDICDLIRNFAKEINLTSELFIQQAIL
ncbi:DUF6978 family protein [Salinimicrobium sp. GXAS 041]|uniref:DUF6978 family protein n=1 Tax=Salinimicrobium sp. GXAS 041 TaxID=3400806 RepID=UPI003C77232A